MIELLRKWLEEWKRQRERDAFNRGYEWGKHAISHATYSVEALEALALGTFYKLPEHYAFDRGLLAAVNEEKGKNNE